MRHCYVLRVFTRDDDGGNHLGVITDPSGLDAAAMQEIATDLGFSETIYLDWRQGTVPGARIFTPATELPFAGHPLVGAAWVLGSLGPGTATGMRCGIGEVAFRTDGDRALVDLPLQPDVDPEPEARAIALDAGLPAPQRGWWARMPIPYLVLEYDDPKVVAAAEPDPDALAAGRSAEATYVIAPAGAGRIKARFFAPALGVFEDPATGSAAAALAAVRMAGGEEFGSLSIDQGDEIGHPSTIELTWRPGICGLGGTVRRDEVRELAQ